MKLEAVLTRVSLQKGIMTRIFEATVNGDSIKANTDNKKIIGVS